MKTVLTRFDGIENSIFSLFSFFLPKPVSHLKLDITYGYNLMIESNLGIKYLNLNAQKTIDIWKPVLGTFLLNKLYRFSKLRHWQWYCPLLGSMPLCKAPIFEWGMHAFSQKLNIMKLFFCFSSEIFCMKPVLVLVHMLIPILYHYIHMSKL